MSEKEPTSELQRKQAKVARQQAKVDRDKFQLDQEEKFGKYDTTEGDDTYQAYIDQRPSEGIVRNGNSLYHTPSGKFASTEEYLEDKTPQAMIQYYDQVMERNSASQDEHNLNDMDLKGLISVMADAERVGDKTTSLDAQEAMATRFDELAEKEGWSAEQKAEKADAVMELVLSLSAQPEDQDEEHDDAELADTSTDSKDHTNALESTEDHSDESTDTESGEEPTRERKPLYNPLAGIESIDDPYEDDDQEKAKRWDKFKHPLAYLSGRLAERSQRVRDHYNEKYINGDEERYKKKQRLLLGATIGVAALTAAWIFRDQIGDAFNNIFGGNNHDVNQFNGGGGTHPSTTPNHEVATPAPSPSEHGVTTPPPSHEVIAPLLHTPEARLYADAYPWDWAADAFPGKNAMTALHHLTDVAQAHGHTVEWLPARGGGQYIKIDGNSNTVAVLNILRPYAG